MKMNKDGEIIIIEDDKDDLFLLEEAFNTLHCVNPRVYFESGKEVIDYLYNPICSPFIILSAINMPYLEKVELTRKLAIDAEIKQNFVPHLFLCTAASQQHVIDAHSISAQGFFVKHPLFEDLKATLAVIINYWKACSPPNIC